MSISPPLRCGDWLAPRLTASRLLDLPRAAVTGYAKSGLSGEAPALVAAALSLRDDAPSTDDDAPGRDCARIVSGCGTVLIEGRPVARVADRASGGDVLDESSATTLVGGVPVARAGDASRSGAIGVSGARRTFLGGGTVRDAADVPTPSSSSPLSVNAAVAIGAALASGSGGAFLAQAAASGMERS